MNNPFSENMRNLSTIPAIRIAGNRTDPDIEIGMTKPPLFCMEKPDSINVLVDAKDGNGTPFNFYVDLQQNLYRCRSIRCTKVIVPKPNNITPFNNEIIIKHEEGTTNSIYLTSALYNTTTFCNEIVSKINAGYVASGIVDTITCSYDPVTKTFTISSVLLKDFFFVDTCSFIKRGKYFAGFESEPIANVPSKTTVHSCMAGMLYTRYITVHSSRLTAFSYADSLASNNLQGGDMIAIINVSDVYNNGDWDISTQFSSNYATIITSDSAQVNLINTQKNMNSVVDIICRDEWQQSLDDVFVNSNGVPNTLGISLFFNIKF
jgi:hypothetical protein